MVATKALTPTSDMALVLTYVLDDHDQEGQLDGKSLLGVHRAGDVVGGDVSAHDLENGGLNISICESLDVSVSDVSVPDLEWLGTIYGEQLDGGGE